MLRLPVLSTIVVLFDVLHGALLFVVPLSVFSCCQHHYRLFTEHAEAK
jgi:hypothetical protein